LKCCILAKTKNKINGIPPSLIKICGVTLIVRILYALKANGINDILIVLDKDTELIKDLIKDGSQIRMNVQYVTTEEMLEIPNIPEEFLDSDLIFIRADVVINPELIKVVINTRGNVICYDNNEFLGICKLNKEALVILNDPSSRESLEKLVEKLSMHVDPPIKLNITQIKVEHEQLKRAISPICIRIVNKESIKKAKRMLIKQTQKGLHFTAYINKPIEDALVYLVSDIPWITPNRITILVNVLAFVVAALFLIGYLKIASIFAYIVGILDGIDGKLARARGVLTKLGHIEHSFDMLFEQTWYVCFALGVFYLTNNLTILFLIPAILVTDSFVRHIYMQFKQTSGKALTAYSNFDRIFAKIDGRRNVYVLYMIVFSLLEMPIYALYFMWGHALLTAMIYSVRAIYHLKKLDEKQGVKGFLNLVGKP